MLFQPAGCWWWGMGCWLLSKPVSLGAGGLGWLAFLHRNSRPIPGPALLRAIHGAATKASPTLLPQLTPSVSGTFKNRKGFIWRRLTTESNFAPARGAHPFSSLYPQARRYSLRTGGMGGPFAAAPWRARCKAVHGRTVNCSGERATHAPRPGTQICRPRKPPDQNKKTPKDSKSFGVFRLPATTISQAA